MVIPADTPSSVIRKILIIGTIAILSFLAAFFYVDHIVERTQTELRTLQQDILLASNEMLMMRRHEKDFMARVDDKYVQKMDQTYRSMQKRLETIAEKIEAYDIASEYDNQSSMLSIDKYQAQFSALSVLVLAIYGDEGGLASELKDSSLALDVALLEVDDNAIDELALSVQDLMYQFFTDFDQRLLPQIEVKLDQLRSEIVARDLPLVEQKFDKVYADFFTLQRAFERYGYSHNEGQHGEMRATIHSVESQLESLFQQLPKHIDQIVSQYKQYRLIASLIVFLSILMILLYVTKQISMLESRLITSRQDEKRANLAKSAFLANMSHEIRTPLNGILGMTEILSDSRLSAIQKDYLATINTSSNTLLMLINDILDLSKIESGQLEICPHTTAVKEVIFDTAALIAPKAHQKGIDIQIELAESIPDYLIIDEQKIRQILMNLASNAIKFTDSGSIRFALGLVSQTDDHVVVSFSVKDSGIGIEESKQSQIFEDFKQENADTSKDYGGTGLGLAICAKMVELMGGAIQVDSRKGEGSEFTFELQFARDTQPEKQTIQAPVVYLSPQPNPLLIAEFKRHNITFDVVESADSAKITQETIIIFEQPEIYPELTALFANHSKVFIRDNKQQINLSHLDVSAFLTHPLFGQRLISTLQNLSKQELNPEVASDVAKQAGDFKILVVEDNRVNQKIVSINLQNMSMDYVVANNGQEAIDIYKADHQNIHLVLMDCMMPVVDGFDATRAIREFESHNNLEPIHIIALTASVLDDDIRKCYQSGMDDYLPKPFQRDVFREKLNTQMRLSEV